MLHLIILEDVERFGGFLRSNVCCCCRRRLGGRGFAGGEVFTVGGGFLEVKGLLGLLEVKGSHILSYSHESCKRSKTVHREFLNCNKPKPILQAIVDYYWETKVCSEWQLSTSTRRTWFPRKQEDQLQAWN